RCAMPTWVSCRDCGQTTKIPGVYSAEAGGGVRACPQCGGKHISSVGGPFGSPGANRTMIYVIAAVVGAASVVLLGGFSCLLLPILLFGISAPATTAQGAATTRAAPAESGGPDTPPAKSP